MLDIRAIANSAIQEVNPDQPTTWIRQIGGYTTAADGTRTPNVETLLIDAQVQGLSSEDLRLVEELNIAGIKRTLIIQGQVGSINRAAQTGGDLFLFPERPGGTVRTWKVISAEIWPTYSRAIVVMQQ